MSELKCSNCGNVIDENDAICKSCGQEIVKKTNELKTEFGKIATEKNQSEKGQNSDLKLEDEKTENVVDVEKQKTANLKNETTDKLENADSVNLENQENNETKKDEVLDIKAVSNSDNENSEKVEKGKFEDLEAENVTLKNEQKEDALNENLQKDDGLEWKTKSSGSIVKHTMVVSKVFSTISAVLVLLMSLLCVVLAIKYAGATGEKTNFIILVFIFSLLAFLFAVFGIYMLVKTYSKHKNIQW